MNQSDLHFKTPLWPSVPLTQAAGVAVDLKMEALQPVGSFKIRGVGNLCRTFVEEGAARLVGSSGGNAGYAMAYAARRLGIAAEIFVPETTPARMRETIRGEGAKVTECGASWDDSHVRALSVANADPAARYVHPFDDARIWAGHATLVHELVEQTDEPDAVVVTVGGGGLLLGVLEGLHAVGWQDVPVVAVETEGADSFARSVAAGELVTLDRIDSLATSLGARRVSAATLEWTTRHVIIPLVVSDRAAVRACARFLDDHRILVEPACGAALAAVYNRADVLQGRRRVLVITCGGAGVSRELLRRWLRAVGLRGED